MSATTKSRDLTATDGLRERVASAILKARYFDVEPEQYGCDEHAFFAELEAETWEDALCEADGALKVIGAELARVLRIFIDPSNNAGMQE